MSILLHMMMMMMINYYNTNFCFKLLHDTLFRKTSKLILPRWKKILSITVIIVEQEFYICGSVQRESNLTIFQLDATYSAYYITVGSSTCFGVDTYHQELIQL